MEIYSCPDILVVHLKRFSHVRGGLFGGGQKINEIVKFPINELDLRKFVINQNFKSCVYDLYAVSNHYGYQDGGHYTAYCKSPITKNWYEFDDSRVS